MKNILCAAGVCRESLVRLIDEYENKTISWEIFQTEVRNIHLDRIGAPHYREAGESPKLEENFYANPFPGCICVESEEVGQEFVARTCYN